MACVVCCEVTHKENEYCAFALDDALENVKKHYKYYQNALKEKEQYIAELQKHNERLMKAVDWLQKNNQTSPSPKFQDDDACKNCKRRRADTKDVAEVAGDEITFIDDEDEEHIAMPSLMDTALNATALEMGANSEIIAETEKQSPRELIPRRRRNFRLKMHNKKPIANDENKVPSSTASLDSKIVSKKSSDWIAKEKKNPETKTLQFDSEKARNLRQTRLQFEEKRERSFGGARPVRSLTLSKIRTKKQNDNTDSDDDAFFDFNNKTASFCFDTTVAENLSNISEPNRSDIELFPLKDDNQHNSDLSLIPLTGPTPTILFLDDTLDSPEKYEEPVRVSKDGMQNFLENSQDSLADFDLNDIVLKESGAPSKICTATTASVSNLAKCSQGQEMTTFLQPSPFEIRIKQEPLTQKPAKQPINPIFGQTESSEEMDDDFIVRPIPIKVEPTKNVDNYIQNPLDNMGCNDCRKYIEENGHRLSKTQLEEDLRKCACHINADDIHAETPDGFWNPLLVSFATNDPRNEVLLDMRFVDK